MMSARELAEVFDEMEQEKERQEAQRRQNERQRRYSWEHEMAILDEESSRDNP